MEDGGVSARVEGQRTQLGEAGDLGTSEADPLGPRRFGGAFLEGHLLPLGFPLKPPEKGGTLERNDTYYIYIYILIYLFICSGSFGNHLWGCEGSFLWAEFRP